MLWVEISLPIQIRTTNLSITSCTFSNPGHPDSGSKNIENPVYDYHHAVNP